MADQPQNFANHTRFDPPFHFFAFPIIALTIIVAIVHCYQRPSWFSAWEVVFVVAVFVITFRTRTYAVKLQDRIIRLEERVRLAGLVSEPLCSRIGELSESQLIGLRFASDGEVSALVQETLSKQLSRDDIKKAVKDWRPDYFRV